MALNCFDFLFSLLLLLLPYRPFSVIMNKPIYLPFFMNDVDIDLTKVIPDDWLTEELKEEIVSHYPKSTDINGGGKERCKESFQEHALELFPSGRKFANYVQLRAAVELYLKAWGASGSHGSSRIACFYGKASKQLKPPSMVTPEKQRVQAPSLKDRKCPFKILYSFQGKRDSDKKNNIFYQVKITSVDYNHTCDLAPESLRLALKGACKLIPDLAGLQDVLSILREHPHLDHKVLRTLLQKYVPFYQSIDGTFIRNFRLRAMSYLDNDHDLTMVEARSLTSRSKSAAEEMVSFDNPMFAKNFKHLLQKTMQDDCTTWEAIAYLRHLSKEVDGFGYRVKYDLKGRPEAICWMLPHMRLNLIRYGDVLFLDSMKKGFNKLAWPYIGPTVKDGEMKIRQVAECIGIEEKLDVYQFVLQSLASIETRWSLTQLQLIFGDQFLTETLLEKLGIEDTCTLRCDYHHVVNEVWPLQFGPSLWKELKPYLTRMLKSKTKEEYKLSFDIAMETARSDPLKASYIEKIFNNPQYYAGYYLKEIDGNLQMMGSAPAEQNHSSICSHLGNGANWTVSENIRQLIERQQTLEKSAAHVDNKLYTSNLNFRSLLIGKDKKNEELAKRNLTKYAFEQLFTRARSAAKELSWEEHDDGTVKLWPHYREQEGNLTITIEDGTRCQCASRKAFRFQCCHELASDGDFILEKYDPRWIMTKVYRKKFPLLCQVSKDVGIPADTCVLPDTRTIIDSVEGPQDNNTEDTTEERTEADLLFTREDNSSSSNNFCYKFLLSRCTELCRTAGHDKNAMAAVVSLVDEATERLRMRLHISPSWTDIGSASIPENTSPMPLPAIPFHHTRPHTQRRFISSLENHRVGKKRKSGTPIDSIVPATEPTANIGRKNKACSLCFQKKHTVRFCPSLEPYKGVPLPRNDSKARSDLAISLSQPNVYATMPREPSLSGQNIILSSLPTGVEAIIIHRRLLIDNGLLIPNVPENFCLEATILHDGGVEHDRYTKTIFELGCISQFVMRSKQNIIICEMKTSSTTSPPVFPVTNPFPQEAFFSQQSMFSQNEIQPHIHNAFPQMGYGYNADI
jgi:hypothetical protein